MEKAAAAIEGSDARALLVDRFRAELAADKELRAEDVPPPFMPGTGDSCRQPFAVAWAERVTELLTRVGMQSDGASTTAAFAALVKEEAAKNAVEARARLLARYRAELRYRFHAWGNTKHDLGNTRPGTRERVEAAET